MDVFFRRTTSLNTSRKQIHFPSRIIISQPLQTANVDTNEKITVTHPFLENYRKEYSLQTRVNRGPAVFLLCTDEEGEEVLIPVEHTNLGKPRLSEDQQEGVPCFDYTNLIELRGIVNSMRNMST